MRINKTYALMLVLLCTTTAWGYENETFQANTVEGVTLTFMVTQESDTWNACRVGRGGKSDQAFNYDNLKAHMPEDGGTLTIPTSVSHNGKTYYVEGVSAYAFSGMYSLVKSIRFSNPQLIKYLGKRSISYCFDLESIDLSGTKITNIPNECFRACLKLTDVKLPSSITTIVDEAFKGCSSLTTFELPSSVTSIGGEAFLNCENLTSFYSYAETPPAAYQWSFDGISSSAVLYVPLGCRDAYLADNVWSSVFSQIKEITSDIEFADENVKAICIANWDANGDGILTTEEAAAVTSINKEFRSNSDIQSFDELRFFIGLKYISKKTFCDCRNLSSIIIPKNVTSIGNEAFYNCCALSSIDIPEGVTSIGEEVFSGCSKLTSITLPNTLQKIGYQAFDGCSGLTSFVFPNSVTTIGGEVFNRCTNLKSVMFPESLTDLGAEVFENCPMIESITIGGNEGIFEAPLNSNALINKETKTLVLGCTRTVVPEDVRHIGNMAFNNCKSLPTIRLPEGLETIGSSAFSGCTGLFSIQLPSSLTSIGSSAFKSCTALPTITIPASVTTIGSEAFYYCSGLSTVVSLSKSPATISEVFWPNTKNITLYVPFGCSMAYRYAGWNGFKEIIEMEPVILPGDANDDGVVDVADVVAIVNYILEKPAENFNMTAADVNGDEVIDAADVVSVVNIILSDSDNGK